MAYDFQRLTVWKKGYELLLRVYKASAKFPKEEDYALKSQIRRSANSVIANIAEAHGRYYPKDKVRVLYLSRAEIEETRSHLIVARGLGYCSPEAISELVSDYNDLSRQLNALINRISNN